MALDIERMNTLTNAVASGVQAAVACDNGEERDFSRNAKAHRDVCIEMGLAVGTVNELP